MVLTTADIKSRGTRLQISLQEIQRSSVPASYDSMSLRQLHTISSATMHAFRDLSRTICRSSLQKGLQAQPCEAHMGGGYGLLVANLQRLILQGSIALSGRLRKQILSKSDTPLPGKYCRRATVTW